MGSDRYVELGVESVEVAIAANKALIGEASLRQDQAAWERSNRKRHAWRAYYCAALRSNASDEECERCADAAIEAEERKFGVIGDAATGL